MSNQKVHALGVLLTELAHEYGARTPERWSNEDRKAQAKAVLKVYAAANSERMLCSEETLTDLLADLMHFVGEATFNECLVRAVHHYQEEKAEV